MTDKIEPALSAREWAKVRDERTWGALPNDLDEVRSKEEPYLPGTIAIANYRLPDSDPRKITREMVQAVRQRAEDEFDAADSMDCSPHAIYYALKKLAAALESYLPPE